MNEIEKAIKTINSIYEDYLLAEDDRVDLRPYDEDVQEIDTILRKALQEKAEREKGCGHCKTHDDFQADMIVFENGNEKVEVQLCFGMLEIIHKRDEEVIYHVDTEINYCPMCGRRLAEE